MSRLRQIDWKEFEKFLFKAGCVFIRERGDHRIWKKTGLQRPIVIPRHNPLPIFIIRNNLRLLEISISDYLKILETT
jgi:predicted RNA binding protein YcfA (HicA-like mRNA interferase family)